MLNMFKVKSKKEGKRCHQEPGSAAPQGDSSLERIKNSKRSNSRMVMVFSNVYGFLFMFSGLEASGSDTDIFTVNGILGESATFPLNIQPSQKVTSISWHSKTSVAFVIPGNFGAEPTVTITHQNYHERISVSDQNYNLELRNLRIEDSGIYKADINVETSKTTTTRSYNLQVYRKLWKERRLVFLFLLGNLLCKNTFISESRVP